MGKALQHRDPRPPPTWPRASSIFACRRCRRTSKANKESGSVARPSAKEDQKSERRASVCGRLPPQWPPAGLELFTSSRWTGLRGRAHSCSMGQTHLWMPPTPEVPSVPDRVATTRESHIHTYPRSRGALPARLPHPPGPWWSGRLPPPPPPRLPLASWPQTSPQGPGPWALQSSPAPGISSVLSSSSFWGVQQLLRLEFCQLKQETREGCHFNPVTQ